MPECRCPAMINRQKLFLIHYNVKESSRISHLHCTVHCTPLSTVYNADAQCLHDHHTCTLCVHVQPIPSCDQCVLAIHVNVQVSFSPSYFLFCSSCYLYTLRLPLTQLLYKGHILIMTVLQDFLNFSFFPQALENTQRYSQPQLTEWCQWHATSLTLL
jgi:hypothetical protein